MRQVPAPPSSRRPAPRTDLVNVLEYEAEARRAATEAVFARVSGGDRAPFDRITLRPRLMVPVRHLDLGLTLFGDTLHSPIIAGPVDTSDLGVPDAAAAIRRGADAAHATVVVTEVVSEPAPARARWFQAFASDPALVDLARRAAGSGHKAIVVTVGASRVGGRIRAAATGANDWRAVSAAAKSAGAPIVVKGVTTPDGARQALEHGAAGIVVSNYGALLGQRDGVSILNLAAIVDAAGGRLPVLMDGGFRRGTDILKALALGASAVLVARPVAWGLIAYGADGVQGVLEMLQTELARYMAMCGKPDLKALDRTVVRVHSR
jgi:4-hydroxymandelate oxidase